MRMTLMKHRKENLNEQSKFHERFQEKTDNKEKEIAQ